MLSKERKFGDVPLWARGGPIDAKNYAYRAEMYCAAISQTRGHVHPTVHKGMPEFLDWWEYFERHLGRIPATFQRIIDEPHSQREFSVPEIVPQLFDSSFRPSREFAASRIAAE